MEKYIDILYKKFRKGDLTQKELEDGLKIIEKEKNKENIKNNYKILYLHLGIAFILSSIVYLVAFNWTSMNSIQKIGTMFIVVIIPFIIYVYETNEVYKKLSLFATQFLMGILFALFGQVYQAGADNYMLFLMWTIAILPMVVIESFLPSYFLIFLTFSIGAILYIIHLGSTMGIITLINIIPVLIIGVSKILLKRKEYMIYKIEKFFITLLFLYYFLGVMSYAFMDSDIFYISILYYVIWAFGIYRIKKTKYYKLLSLIPLISLIPPIIIIPFVKGIKNFNLMEEIIGMFLFMVILIIVAYIGLIKGINYIRGEEDE